MTLCHCDIHIWRVYVIFLNESVVIVFIHTWRMLLPSRSTLSRSSLRVVYIKILHLLPNSYFSCLAFFFPDRQIHVTFLDRNRRHGYVCRYLCLLCSRACSWHKSHILKWNNYSYTCVWIVGLTSKWWMKPSGIWNGHCFLTLITPVLQEDINTFPHFCSLAGTKSYFICQESLRHLLGLICSRLHLRATCQLPGLLHLPVKTGFSASCTITNASLSCW